MGEGYIALSRKYFEHAFWLEKKEYDRADAWLDLIRRSNYRPNRVVVNNRFIDLKRGELVASIRYLARQWGWSVNRVQNFLKLLRLDTMIDTRTDQGITVIKLCNYEHYNNAKTDNEYSNEHTNGYTGEYSPDTPQIQGGYAPDTRQNKEKKVKKVNNKNNSNELKAPANKSDKPPKSSIKILEEETTIEKLRTEFPEIDVGREIEKMRDWLSSKGKRMKDYPAFARNWLRRCQEKIQNNIKNGEQRNKNNSHVEKIGNTPIENIRRAKAILDSEEDQFGF